MSDAEDYDLNPEIRPGVLVPEGFQDKAGAYPQVRYRNESGVNTAARTARTTGKSSSGTRGPRVSSRIPQIASRVLSEPAVEGESRYPHNNATFTKSGHMIEYDDTPGNERINIQHRTGAKVEILPDGSIVTRSQNKSYEIVAGDKEAIIRGQVTIVVESNADMRVQGDLNMQVDGDYNHLVQGNYNLEVQGNRNTRIHGDDSVRRTGGKLDETRGNVVERNLSNFRERTVGDHDSEYGGSWTTTVEGDIHQRSYGPFNGSYYGGFVTLNGDDKDGNVGEGSFECKTIYSTDVHGVNAYFSTDGHWGGDFYVDGNLNVGSSAFAGSAVHATTFEGTATRAGWATTAGSAPTGASSPTTPSPTSPTNGTAPTDAPSSEESVVDVTGTSDAFILDLDRQPVTGYNKRLLNTGEVIARCRNKKLRTDSAWLQDQIDSGAITTSISSSTSPRVKRTGGTSTVGTGDNNLNQRAASNFLLPTSSLLRVDTIPENALITGSISKATRLSPNFRTASMLAGDSLGAALKAQVGLSATQIANNMQLVSYNVLEVLRNKYKDNWTISEGLYNLLENEKIDSSSLTYEMAQGLGVGIQLVTQPNGFYFDVAQWIRNHLVFDKLVLSYIDYDPAGINEPTIIVTVKPGQNSKTVWTEFNHVKVDDNLLDLS